MIANLLLRTSGQLGAVQQHNRKKLVVYTFIKQWQKKIIDVSQFLFHNLHPEHTHICNKWERNRHSLIWFEADNNQLFSECSMKHIAKKIVCLTTREKFLIYSTILVRGWSNAKRFISSNAVWICFIEDDPKFRWCTCRRVMWEVEWRSWTRFSCNMHMS